MSGIVLANACLWIPVPKTKTKSKAGEVGAPIVSRGANDFASILEDVNLELGHGDRVGLIGHNGSGKTSLLRMMAGIYPPTSGSVRVDGSVAPMLTSGVGLSQDLSGTENILVASRIFGVPHSRFQGLVEDVSEFSELGPYLDRPLRTYSAGMKARLSFGLITAIDASILLIDEVIGAGDPSFRKRSAARLQERMKSASLMVLATHSYSLLEAFCDQLIWLDRGRIRRFGGLRDIYGEYLEYQDKKNKADLAARKVSEEESRIRNEIRNERKARLR